MNSNPKTDPTPEERAKAEIAIRKFMVAQQAIPKSKRTVISTDKYDGPIGELPQTNKDTPDQEQPITSS